MKLFEGKYFFGYDKNLVMIFLVISLWFGRLKIFLLEELFFICWGNVFKLLLKVLVKVNFMVKVEDFVMFNDFLKNYLNRFIL